MARALVEAAQHGNHEAFEVLAVAAGDRHFGKARQHHPDVQQAEAFTREVGMRAVVNRVESLDVPAVMPE